MPLLSLDGGILHQNGMSLYLDDTGYEKAIGDRSVAKNTGSFTVNPALPSRIITGEAGIREIETNDQPRVHVVDEPARTT